MVSTCPCQEKIGLKFLFFLDPLDPAGYCLNKYPLFHSKKPGTKFMVKSKSGKPRLIGLYMRNYAANFSGNIIIVILNFFTPLTLFEYWRDSLAEGGWVLFPIAIPSNFLIVTFVQYLVQRPISAILKKFQFGEKVEVQLQEKARRRLLNLPFTIGLANLTIWIAFTTILMPIMYLRLDMTVPSFFYGYFRFVMIGLIASFISFFLIDDYCRKKLVPTLFPLGRLSTVSGTIKISILRRIRVLFGAGTIAPLILLLGTLAFAVWEIEGTAVSASDFGEQVLVFTVVLCLIFIVISFSLNFLAGKSILTPIKEMMRVVKKIRHGKFHHTVHVVSNDELGVLGDGMNEMAAGLIERDRMRRALYLAKEVQQALLPRMAPRVKMLDIASTSVYCDETGGDYYDFLSGDEPQAGKISVVVGDVSGHGVSSALLMATARAFLRQRSALPGSVSRIVSDVNRQLARDVEESGGFMTLFYLTIDAGNRKLNWVRAGHDPAIFYDPATDTFQELRGAGMALGVKADARFEENRKNNLKKNQIIILGTDGIWEARNLRGKMFGKEPIYRAIRQNSGLSAKEILTGIFNTLNRFLEDRALEDDVTLVVIKVMDD
jgi:sigma-B regulation protein RsbU (phosphoserine phosphatase)